MRYTEGSGSLKISSKPSQQTVALLQCLKEIGLVLAEVKKCEDGPASVPEILAQSGVNDQIRVLWSHLEERANTWSESFRNKLEAAAQAQAASFVALKIPYYKALEHEASSDEIAKYKGMEKVVSTVGTMKSFAAACKICSGLAGVSCDTADLSSAILEGCCFVYIYGIITICRCPSWKSMTPELASKEESKYGEVTKNLRFALKSAADEGIQLPGEVQSLASKMLSKAGVTA